MKRAKLKARRKSLGLSQRDMARRLGCTRSHYANIENGYREGERYMGRIKRMLRS